MKVAFIGLGKMGAAMAERILQAGITLSVYSRTESKLAPLVEQGARGTSSLQEAVSDADVVISCLLDDAALTQTSLAKEGLLNVMKPDAVHISTATILPSTAEEMFQAYKKAGLHYVSAAVLGVPQVVREGKLLAFCAGDADAVDACEPVLKTFSEEIINLGEDAKAPLVMKVGLNYALATSLELISELYVFFEKSGLDLEIIQSGLHRIYGHPGYKRYIDKIKARDFDEVNFDMKGGSKDISIFQKAFADVGVVPRLGDLLKGRFIAALAHDMGDKDWSGIYEIIRQEAGLDDNKP